MDLLDGANGFELCQVHGPPRGSPRAVRDLLLSLQRFLEKRNARPVGRLFMVNPCRYIWSRG